MHPNRSSACGSREPGDLPFRTGTVARTWGDATPLANTEVVMAARTVSAIPISVSQRVTTGLAALLLGAFFVWGVGLANSSALHDTAHDTRHSYGFPCH